MKKKKRLHPEDINLIVDNVIQQLQFMVENKPEKKWITTNEVVELLGISSSKLHQMRVKNLITFTSFGRNIYYDLSEIHHILEENKVNRMLS